MTRACKKKLQRPQRGLTLVELVVALALGAVILTSIWKAWSLLGLHSADPLVARQQLAVAQSLLREIELQPLPGTAASAATAGRTGYASITDYNGLAMTGIKDAEGNTIAGLEAYGAAITVSAMALQGVPINQGWWVGITVTGPGGEQLTMGQWRSVR